MQAGFRIWARNWLPWAVVTLLLSGVVTILVAWIDPWFGTYGFADLFSGEPLTAITAALYLELRARKGSLDQGVLRAKLARFDGS